MHVILFLCRPVDFLLPVTVHPHIDIKNENLRIREELLDLNGLFRSNTAAYLGAVLITDPAISRAYALNKADALRLLPIGRSHEILRFEHSLSIRQGNHIVELIVAVHLGLLTRIEVVESRADDDRSRRYTLRMAVFTDSDPEVSRRSFAGGHR